MPAPHRWRAASSARALAAGEAAGDFFGPFDQDWEEIHLRFVVLETPPRSPVNRSSREVGGFAANEALKDHDPVRARPPARSSAVCPVRLQNPKLGVPQGLEGSNSSLSLGMRTPSTLPACRGFSFRAPQSGNVRPRPEDESQAAFREAVAWPNAPIRNGFRARHDRASSQSL